jgi:hypothetical protein
LHELLKLPNAKNDYVVEIPLPPAIEYFDRKPKLFLFCVE